jgi:nucleoid-associated protein YgaU
MYTVKSGDVLGSISKTVYGSTKHWRRIYDANRDVIGDDPNRLKVGMQLRIPELK